MIGSNFSLILGVVDINYDCSDKGCHPGYPYNEDEDWGYYSKTKGDCNYCKIQCNSDPNCGGIECGAEYCSWWKVGICSLLDSNTNRHTCRKNSIGIQKLSFNILYIIWIKTSICNLFISTRAFWKSDSVRCCSKVIISGVGAVKELHEDRLGEYEFYGISNNRSIYKMGDQEKMGHEYYLSWTDRYTPWKEFAWTVSFWKEYLKASAGFRFIKLFNTVPCYSAQIKHLNL